MFVTVNVVKGKKFSIYVYEDHPPPHCHVRFPDNSEISVSLPFIEPLYRATITKEIEEAIEKNLDLLTNIWDKLNKPRQQKK